MPTLIIAIGGGARTAAQPFVNEGFHVREIDVAGSSVSQVPIERRYEVGDGELHLSAEQRDRLVQVAQESEAVALLVSAGGHTGSRLAIEVGEELHAHAIPFSLHTTLPLAFEGFAREKAAADLIHKVKDTATEIHMFPLDALMARLPEEAEETALMELAATKLRDSVRAALEL